MRLLFSSVLCFSHLVLAVRDYDTFVTGYVPPFSTVFGRCSWEFWPAGLLVQNQPLMSHQALVFLPFVSLSVWRLSFFLLFQHSWPMVERSTEWLYVLSSDVEYFGDTVFLAKHVSLSFKWLQQNECDSGFPSWHEHLTSYISFWKISIFSLPWSYTAFKAFYILL